MFCLLERRQTSELLGQSCDFGAAVLSDVGRFSILNKFFVIVSSKDLLSVKILRRNFGRNNLSKSRCKIN